MEKPPENDRKRCYVQYKMKGPDFHATCDNINHIISALIKSARPLARFSARWRNKNKCGTKTCTTSKHPFRLIALVFNRHTCPALRQTRRPRASAHLLNSSGLSAGESRPRIQIERLAQLANISIMSSTDSSSYILYTELLRHLQASPLSPIVSHKQLADTDTVRLGGL